MGGMHVRHEHIFALLGLTLGTWALANVWRLAAMLWSLSPTVNRWTDRACGVLGCLALLIWVTGCIRESYLGRSVRTRTNVLALPFWVSEHATELISCHDPMIEATVASSR